MSQITLNFADALPPLSKMFCAEGCQMTRPTRRWWATRSATGSSRFTVRPPSGICHTLTVQSSDPLAMRSSSCGHHWMSSTAALCPTTSGASRSTRPTWRVKQTVRHSHFRKLHEYKMCITAAFVKLTSQSSAYPKRYISSNCSIT